MKIIFKHTLKNVFKKPLRTLLVVFCVMICSLSALLCFDMSGALKGMFRNLYGQYLGSMDVLVSGSDFDENLMTDPELPESNKVAIYGTTNIFIHDLEGEYTYVEQDTVTIMGFDLENAVKMGMIPFNRILADNEVALSHDFAEKYGYSEGDTVILHDEVKAEHEYKVVLIVDSHGKGLMAQNTAVLSVEGMSALVSDMKIAQVAIDVKNDAEVSAAVEYIKEQYPNLKPDSLFDNDQMNDFIDQMTKMFFVLFAVCVLMVIFVTISISERIISERMSVVGTFRSLGLSTRLTTFILLLENAFYGLIGSALGCLLYSVLRAGLFDSLLTAKDAQGNAIAIELGGINPLLVLSIIACAILVECLCPIKEVLKAVKIPIRDIIFSNKNTEYKFHRVSTVIGIACAAAALILAFVPNGFFQKIAQFALMTVALSLLFPYLLNFAGKLFSKIFDRRGMPIAKLAVTEVYTKKSTVGSSILITTAAALAIVVYTVATSLSAMVDTRFFSSDVYITPNYTQKTAYYNFIEDLDTVKDVEYIYSSMDNIRINGTDVKNASILSVDENGYDLFTGIQDVPVLAGSEASFSKVLADKYGIGVGDEVALEFHKDSYYPIAKTFTIASLCDTSQYDESGSIIVLSEELIKEIYGDYPGMILVSTNDPIGVDKSVEKYAKGAYSSSYTTAEYDAESRANTAGIMSIISFAIVLGISLTFIGSVSNLLIGFEGRKRECAILLSTSLSQKQLSRMFFLESLFSSGLALVAAIPMGILMQKPIFGSLSAISASVEIKTGLGAYILFILALWIVFIMTSRFPIRAARKMKLSEQLKYE